MGWKATGEAGIPLAWAQFHRAIVRAECTHHFPNGTDRQSTKNIPPFSFFLNTFRTFSTSKFNRQQNMETRIYMEKLPSFDEREER